MVNEQVVAPCKNCKERFSGCHSKCEKYQQWKVDFEKEKAKAKEIKSLDWFSRSLNDCDSFKGKRYKRGKE